MQRAKSLNKIYITSISRKKVQQSLWKNHLIFKNSTVNDGKKFD